jgi:hypothetical protein
MVKKGKVEETILEAIPQLAIQLCNTWLLGQLNNMPPFTIFSISLSVISLANTMWYYAYWNLFRCMPIRHVPSTLALYNYKLSGVTDGAFSFAKTSHEVVEIELSEMDKLKIVTIVNPSALNCDEGVHQPHQLPSTNAMVHDVEPTASVSLNTTPSSDHCDSKTEVTAKDALKCGNHRETQERNICLSNMRKARVHIASLQHEMQQMEAEMNTLRLEIESRKRASCTALESAIAPAKVTTNMIVAAPSTDCAGDCLSCYHSHSDTRAAITIQSVTRGHIGRLRFQDRCRQVTQQLLSEDVISQTQATDLQPVAVASAHDEGAGQAIAYTDSCFNGGGRCN